MDRRVRLFGCPFDVVDMAGALRRVEGYVASGALHQGVGVNVDQLVKMKDDPAFKAVVSACDLVTADGTPVVWASRLFGKPLPERVSGIDLFEALLPLAAERGFGVYLLGAREEVLQSARAEYLRRHPGLRIVGARNGYFAEEDEAGIAAEIRESGAQLLFLGFSSPKKERFVERNREALAKVGFILGVGGAFDIAAGVTRRAPPWMARAGLEWSWRLAQEPRRLARRYLVDDSQFLGMLAKEAWYTARDCYPAS